MDVGVDRVLFFNVIDVNRNGLQVKANVASGNSGAVVSDNLDDFQALAGVYDARCLASLKLK